jgi:deoxyribose-phosphate aldolase
MKQLSWDELARMIDHAVLKPDATVDDVRSACELAARYRVASLFVRPCDVVQAVELLGESGVAVGTVIGFPHGTAHSEVKSAEARQDVADGADELDMVINVARLKDGECEYVRDEIAGVVTASGGRIVKVILECCYLTREQMAMGCKAAESASANFVKTSTGFGEYGARVEDVQFLRSQVGDRLGVKAAGGIRTLTDALSMIHAGATRIGTSSTQQILGDL